MARLSHFQIQKKYKIILNIQAQSGFAWDNELGAGIDSTSEAVWAAYIKRCTDAAPFHNKGWPHFDKVDALLSTTASTGTHAFHAALEEPHKPLPDLDFLNEEGLLQPGPEDAPSRDDQDILDEGEDDEDLIPWEKTPPRQSHTPALLLKRKSDNTLAPASKRHYFTNAFCSSSQPQPSTLTPSPIRRQCAMQHAQNIETHLTADDMAALIEAFQTDVSAADTYMVMQDDNARCSFINQKITQINSQ
ncbi:hypothetical protein EV424DRAFT_1534071 [Suillus variegatus]|nr:hypothetical protein EV424DRAFT_1534071 [Suillus variegatus]